MLAETLVFLDVGVAAGPVAVGMHTFSHEVIDDVQRDQVLLELSLELGLAQRTGSVGGRPVFNTDVAKGMTEYCVKLTHRQSSRDLRRRPGKCCT